MTQPTTAPTTSSTPTTSARDTVTQALRYLAGVCDGAATRDGAGFNRMDSGFGKDLATKSLQAPLTPGQLRAALRLLGKYSAQLARAGLLLPDVATLDAGLDATLNATLAQGTLPPPAGTLDLRAGQVLVSFPYDPAKVTAVKALRAQFGGQGWDPLEKVWRLNVTATPPLLTTFPTFARTDAFAAALALLEARITSAVEELDTEASRRAQMVASLRAALGDLSAPLPAGRVLFAHQRAGVLSLLDLLTQYRGGILADEMGLGKTTVALVAAKAFGLPIFVIAPVSLRANWLREAEQVGVAVEVYSWAKIPEPPRHPTRGYVLICDEAHAMQTWGAYRYDERAGKVVLKGTRRTADAIRLATDDHCAAVYLLTGTPIKNGRPANLYPLLYAIGHPLAAKKSAFERHFCAACETRWSRWDITGAAHLDELHHATSGAIIRRTKKECLDLPAKMRVLQPVELSPEAYALYEERLGELVEAHEQRVAEKVAALVAEGTDPLVAAELATQGDALVALGQYRLAGALAKTETALEMVREQVETGHQVVVFSQFVEATARMGATLTQEGITNAVLSGATAQAERDPMVQRFQGGDTAVLLCTGGAGGVGITLTAAQTVILLDRPWTPGDALQQEDRCHRIGQMGTVTCYWLQCGEIDEKVDAILTAKAARIDLVLKGARKTLRGVSSPMAVARELLGEVLGSREVHRAAPRHATRV